MIIKHFIFILSICSYILCCTPSNQLGQRGIYLAPNTEIKLGNNICDVQGMKNTWAVVIGVNQYRDPGIPDLKGAAQDAWSFYHYLTHKDGAQIHPARTKLLINEKATKANIEEALGEFLTQACPQDQVIIYFAGHGAPEPDRPDDAFLLTHDTRLSRLVSTALSMQQLPQFLTWRTNSAGKLIFLVDACHSGSIQFPGSRGFTQVSTQERNIEQLRAKSLLKSLSTVSNSQSGWGVISSSAADQLSAEGGRDCQVGEHTYSGGTFTCALLNAIHHSNDKDQDGELSYDELYWAVSHHLTELRGVKQTPQRSGNMSGKEVIFIAPTHPVPIPPLARRYYKDYSARPYRPWIWTSLAAASVSTGLAVYFQSSSNQSTTQLNNFLEDDIGEKTTAVYDSINQDRLAFQNQSKWSYIGAALLGVSLATLGILEWKTRPPPLEEAYGRPPQFYIGSQRKTLTASAKEQTIYPQSTEATHE